MTEAEDPDGGRPGISFLWTSRLLFAIRKPVRPGPELNGTMKRNTTIATCLALLLTSTALLAQTTAPATLTNAAPVKNPWDASLALGATVTRGNSKTLLLSGSFQGLKKWDQNEVDLGADAVYGEDHDVKNAEALHGFGQYNRLFSERWFGLVRLDGLHDGIADIDYRISASAGLGYYFIKNTDTSLRAEVGPGYIYELQGNGDSHSYMTIRVAERFDQKLSQTAKLWEGVEYLPQVDRFQNYIINAEIGVESAMSKTLSLQAVLQDSYHSEPAAGREQNDLKLIAGVKYKF
jgi:putative salt-induced outer membrane protein